MSNSKLTNTSLDLNRNSGQKKRKTTQMSSQPFDDTFIERIVADLPLSRRLQLRSVSKQFKTCVDRTLANEESIQLVGTYGEDLDVFVNKYNKNRIHLNKIGFDFDDNNECLVHLLSKLEQIKRLEFDNNIRINNRMLEWIFKRFPKLSSLSLMDYRCNYLTLDWMSIGDKLSQNLISLQIECRLNQQILSQTLADLVAKLERLEELTIVCPRRNLQKVFAAFGPNLVKLRITYCLGLYFDEIMALIDGNGRHLQELDIHYEIFGHRKEQNTEFIVICKNLLSLKSFTFSHSTLSTEALGMISNLKKLSKFVYNYSGCNIYRRNHQSMDIIDYDYKFLEFKSIQVVVRSLQSLSLVNVELRPQIMFNWNTLFPNVKHLHLKCIFLCGCHSRHGSQCFNCLRLCFSYLSELNCLRSIDFAESMNVTNIQYFNVLKQIQLLKINCYLLERSYLLNVLSVLIKMATERKGRTLFVRLYHLRYNAMNRIRRFVEIPPNLKITFQLYSDNKLKTK